MTARTNDAANVSYLIGRVTSLKYNTISSRVQICLEEQRIEKPCTLAGKRDADSRGHQQSFYLITFVGHWCRMITHDLEETSILKLYLEGGVPGHHSAGSRWEFHNGIHAELTFEDHDGSPITKTIDIGTRLPSNTSAPTLQPTSSRDYPERKCLYTPPATNHSKGSRLHPDDYDQTSPSANRQDQAWTRQNSHKRPKIQSNESATRIPYPPSESDRCQASTATSPNVSQTPIQLHSTQQVSTSCTAWPQISRDPPPGLKEQGFALKTLHEIDRIPGGYDDLFSVVAIIDAMQTEECRPVSGGTSDYKMTLYLRDLSRQEEEKPVTCNLFWKTAEDCPPWGKARWKVIFLSNVYKRPSDVYNTQIIGRSSHFQWALWSPRRSDAAEQFHSSSENIAEFSSLFCISPGRLVATARDLCVPSKLIPVSERALSPVGSVPKSIWELGHDLDKQFDLCVQIVDLWIDDSGNDRMTVTDFTPNPALRMVQPNMQTKANQTRLRFHEEHGGYKSDYGKTESRMMVVYVEPPILKSIYNHFDKAGDSGNPSGDDYRRDLVNKVVRLTQIDLCFDTNTKYSGLMYGLMTNPYVPKGVRPEKSFDFDPNSIPLLANRVVPLMPSEPAYQKLLQYEASYEQELREFCLEES
ncbi:hypothetical protein MJO29_000223 [Puccinia striiformis f. sp. tritici]|nr:hypothetical protein Pst134EB_001431 [Puccinia striiformis f. sp. tritici]KAI7966946.1 hypothetical protein MJO29_000223 [Puccinia striiformis f. sp. tritici]